MAQRHEIEAWLNPDQGDDADLCDRIADAIEATGSDDEAVWVRILHEHLGDGERAMDLELEAATRTYDRAGEAMDEARDALYSAIREAVAAGMSKYRAAQATGLSQPMIARIVKG